VAREGRFLHADTLMAAIHQASVLLADPIERVVVVGDTIRIDAGGRRAVFRRSVSHAMSADGTPMAGGTSGEAVLVEEAALPAGRLRGLLRRLGGRPAKG
jgi:hypothetical protein